MHNLCIKKKKHLHLINTELADKQDYPEWE